MTVKDPQHIKSSSSAAKTILTAGFIAGTLDISGAIIIYCYIMRALTPVQLLHGIARGVFGDHIIGTDTTMALIGLCFHYIIAYCFAAGYLLVFPYVPFLRRHKIISGLGYGVFVWCIMNCIVLPLSNVHHYPFKWQNALIAVAILMVCIGLPVSIITNKYHSVRSE
jgi:hypothetical protein